MDFWTKLQYATLGLIDLVREQVEELAERGTKVVGGKKPSGKKVAEAAKPAVAVKAKKKPSPRPSGPKMTREQQRKHVLDALAGGKVMTLGEIAGLVGRKAQGFGRTIGPLVAEGVVERKADGRYALKKK